MSQIKLVKNKVKQPLFVTQAKSCTIKSFPFDYTGFICHMPDSKSTTQ